MSAQNEEDRERERILWCGNLHNDVTEELLYELFLQAGPLESVKIVASKDGKGRNYAFIKFKHAVSVPYAKQLMDGIRLFGLALRLQSRNGGASEPPMTPQQPEAPRRAAGGGYDQPPPNYNMQRCNSMPNGRNGEALTLNNAGQRGAGVSQMGGQWMGQYGAQDPRMVQMGGPAAAMQMQQFQLMQQMQMQQWQQAANQWSGGGSGSAGGSSRRDHGHKPYGGEGEGGHHGYRSRR